MGCIDHGQRGDYSGYGKKKYKGRAIGYHVYAYCTANNVDPDTVGRAFGTCIRHTCDNPRCINPQHLRIGSHVDNMRDRDARGRTCRGDSSGKSKVASSDVPIIIRDFAAGVSATCLASKYGVTDGTIRRIAKGVRR